MTQAQDFFSVSTAASVSIGEQLTEASLDGVRQNGVCPARREVPQSVSLVASLSASPEKKAAVPESLAAAVR